MLNVDPQTATKMKMVASYCALCSRDLCDAKSVEIGIGPVCRKKHGYGYADELSEDQRKKANALIYQIAIDQTGPGVVAAAEKLFDLGFSKLVARIMQRIAQVVVAVEDNGRLAVKTPYDYSVVGAMQKVTGRKWDKVRKVNTFPMAARNEIYAMLRKYFAGKNAVGPKGPFVIPSLDDKGTTKKAAAPVAVEAPKPEPKENPFTESTALSYLTDAEYAMCAEEEFTGMGYEVDELTAFAKACLVSKWAA